MSQTTQSTATGHDQTQVLRFTLGEEEYCLNIEYVAEIVEGDTLTTIPDADPHVEGIMHLRGQTTTIINPYTLLDIDTPETTADDLFDSHRVIVLDSTTLDIEDTLGWLVASVNEVTAIDGQTLQTDEVAESEYLQGILRDDDQDEYILWLDPTTIVG